MNPGRFSYEATAFGYTTDYWTSVAMLRHITASGCISECLTLLETFCLNITPIYGYSNKNRIGAILS
jgi:hypothetical protein